VVLRTANSAATKLNGAVGGFRVSMREGAQGILLVFWHGAKLTRPLTDVPSASGLCCSFCAGSQRKHQFDSCAPSSTRQFSVARRERQAKPRGGFEISGVVNRDLELTG
jgi:hypothetical protein